MGKVRGRKEGRGRGGDKDNALGKISAEIGAISLGPPRSKILKKTGGASSSSGSSLTVNFASRIVSSSQQNQNKQKKRVTFCQNLIAEELKERSEAAKQYFKVVHPAAIEKRRREGKPLLSGASRVAAVIPEKEVLLGTSASNLRKIIKKGVKSKKIRLKARKESFKKKMELIKQNKDELLKAKQRQQTVIVGDLHPILESLPSLEMEEDKPQTELPSRTDEEMKTIPKKTKFSVKKTQKAILDSLKFFEAAGVGKTAAGLSAN